ncbi:hypothetical protein AAT19DRAFT_15331 [Rhodotorula toruloides]|uniref:Uncharacterized protein n=1 Tax=Rhodotorula toruloides TaxID=5286 RepID=A0A2T0A6W0_RHOTO|nr:hypothetical protein AAT19DRAFT_15331 [Rhodotorula toruloides]
MSHPAQRQLQIAKPAPYLERHCMPTQALPVCCNDATALAKPVAFKRENVGGRLISLARRASMALGAAVDTDCDRRACSAVGERECGVRAERVSGERGRWR